MLKFIEITDAYGPKTINLTAIQMISPYGDGTRIRLQGSEADGELTLIAKEPYETVRSMLPK